MLGEQPTNNQERERVEAGIRMAAIFGCAPAQMKLCGRKNKETPQTLQDFLAKKSGVDFARAREVLENFEAATEYYKLIATANNIPDHFDERVVEAYWIGNDLLKNVQPDDIKKMILEKFVGAKMMTQEDAEARVAQLPADIVAHHNFHVLTLGAASAEARQVAGLYELCSVNFGTVVNIADDKVTTKCKPIILQDGKFKLGNVEVEKQINWDKNIVPEIKNGDSVCFHWNQVCKKLTAEQQQNLEYYIR
ncbi:hypothetical protein HY932_02925 [Candidatus Falkowbacteria bacterium]|nr:hypothetical protein [Candidatus Falkowbacteria bacterium]